MVVEAKIQKGIINAVNKIKTKAIPSKPKDKYKLYSGMIGNWHVNWKSNSLERSKKYKISRHASRKPIVVIRAKLRIPCSSLFGISEIIIVEQIKYPSITNQTGVLGRPVLLERFNMFKKFNNFIVIFYFFFFKIIQLNLTSSSVNSNKEKNSYDVYKMSISSCSFKPKMLIFCQRIFS